MAKSETVAVKIKTAELGKTSGDHRAIILDCLGKDKTSHQCHIICNDTVISKGKNKGETMLERAIARFGEYANPKVTSPKLLAKFVADGKLNGLVGKIAIRESEDFDNPNVDFYFEDEPVAQGGDTAVASVDEWMSTGSTKKASKDDASDEW